MPKTDKAKTAGKFIVVMLCFAILFFLLLPFLEDSSVSSSQGTTKKATPQIFTSNPLSELVRKVYSLFAGNKKHSPSQGALYAAGSDELIPQEDGADFQRYATAEGNATSAGGNSTTSYVPGNYEYGDAGFINEEGEWVLVQQTVPEASQRGMHEINSSDSAYDKFQRLQRAAKYTPQPAAVQPPIPDSKWARLFRPIKKLFGLGEKETNLSEDKNSPEAFALASASSGLGRNDSRTPTERFASRGALSMPSINGMGGAGSSNQIQFDLLDPFSSIEESAEGLTASASSILDPQDQKQFTKFVEQQKAQRLLAMRKQILNDITQDAQGSEPKELVSVTRDCQGSTSGLYKQQSGCLLPESIPDETQRSQLNQQAEENQKASRQIIDKKISELTGTNYQSKEPIDMLVLLSKTKAGENAVAQLVEDSEADPQATEMFKDFYNYMYTKQGCDKHDCYWVGVEYMPNPSLRHTIQSAGMEYLSDPLRIHPKLFNEFQNEKWMEMAENTSDANKGQETDDLMKSFNQMLEKHTLYYVPYTKENMDQVNQRNTSKTVNGKMQKPENPFVVYVPSAANLLDAREVLPYPYFVIYDDKQSLILDQANPKSSVKERGEQIRDLYIQRLQYGADLAKKERHELEEKSAAELLSRSAEQVRKDLQQINLQNMEEAERAVTSKK